MNRTLISCLLLSSMVISHAGIMGTVADSSGFLYQPFISISGGAAWQDQSVRQTLALTPTTARTYTAPSTDHALGVGEVVVGIQQAFGTYYNVPMLLQWGVNFAYGGQAKIRGAIWDDANPIFDNYRYATL